MKKLTVVLGVALLSIFITGCVAPVGGSYGVAYGEYPTTYYGTYYAHPAYTYGYPAHYHWDRHYHPESHAHHDWHDSYRR
jgi:hypothetical protein